jgi:hypothetical protein
MKMVLILMALALAFGAQHVGAAKLPEKTDQEKVREKLMQVYSYADPKAPKAAYEGKTFNTGGGFSDKKFSTKDYAGNKEFQSKSYETKPYGDSKRSWLGKLFPEKKLSENLQGANRDATKSFATKDVPVKEFDANGKTSPYSSKEAFEAKELSLKGKSQGAIDNDPHLQEAVKKGLSIDDVRKLLNKPGGSSQ